VVDLFRLIFETPMCLVSTQGGKLQVEANALNLIEEINKPLVVVAIAGLYRTGKSYLMNRLAGVTRGIVLECFLLDKNATCSTKTTTVLIQLNKLLSI
jgi:ribosome biogenesis GTPase A